ncbi:(2Fe-2S)-binding protein [Euzebya tangerina]|uniref:(2Fe-2S)-binding protein n=1 Tax=Euzebya tangerina TaxID=591198 RepID=UPI000E324DBD|nr:(2Fe-2S)-binding protein [Euzebya tangerina]
MTDLTTSTAVTVTMTVNGVEHSSELDPRTLLVDHIRTGLGLTGTHIGCDTTSCGVCTVLLDGKPIKACTMFAVMADGAEIMTVEGLKQNGELHPVQAAFKEKHGLQCGYCTPAMMLVGAALLEENDDPGDDEVRWAISGNLCRCTGYMNIVESIQEAGAQMRAGSNGVEADDMELQDEQTDADRPKEATMQEVAE